MSDNVIIFGAGASVGAGIPLLSNFVETMWKFAIQGNVNGQKLTDFDQALFNRAMDLKFELDRYHGRANFDDRNLEDILSLISFNQILHPRRHDMSVFTKAIARTIELTCRIKHPIDLKAFSWYTSGYNSFWFKLFARFKQYKSVPTIITFNYDLVLERALYAYFRRERKEEPPEYRSDIISLNYYCKNFDRFGLAISERKSDCYPDTYLAPLDLSGIKQDAPNHLKIDLLKLHGSVNFSRKPSKKGNSLTSPVEDPLILPPIFSKMEQGKPLEETWRIALQRLRQAKNIFIVGYSLPITDTYMQYFLKTALGPNENVNRIYVYDPVLFPDETPESKKACADMKERYAACFSNQLQKLICFQPPRGSDPRILRGSFLDFGEHFNYLLF